MARLPDDGAFGNDVPGRFTGGYGVLVEEVAPFFAQHGFTRLALLGSQSVTAGLEDALAELERNDLVAYHAVLDTAIRTAGDPSIPGLCHHLLYIGRKSQ